MSIQPFTALACPLDGAPLNRQDAAWKCAAGHSFDIASQGHTHLLPVQHKRSLDPGDSKEMVAARRHFLNAGHYRPIAEAAARAALTAAFDLIGAALRFGEAVQIKGFGRFEARDTPERPGRNPKTGEPRTIAAIPISARRVVTFRPGQKLKVRVEAYAGSGQQ